ncbi:MAG: DUF2267 domain-containing protein [Beijerinckiaceae bacterium]|jgi:uncharacterized protein (DUF2267 family)|nr:DUF2267 domain-containing protein [Beijerinckiaceae bacterium]
MPVPMEYRLASQNFDRFLAEVAEATGLATRNQAYTTTQAVLQAFRRRLDTAQAIAFAQVLPAMLRALFVMDWDPQEPRVTGWDRAAMTEEVKQLRIDHNFSPASAIADVARVLRAYVDAAAFARCLATLPPEARAIWAVQ